MMIHFTTGGDYFSALNLTPNANQDEIKKSFRYYSRLYHPDRAAGDQSDLHFRNLQKAYDVLMQPKLLTLCKMHLTTEGLGLYLENLNSQMKRDHDFLEKIELKVLLLQFDEIRFYRDPERSKLQIGKTILYTERGLIEQQLHYGNINFSTFYNFGNIKGFDADYSNDFDYDGQRYYYGFSFEHKKLKTEENRNLTFISPLDHDTTSIYEIESHFQTNRFKISPFVRVADFYEEQGPDDEGNYQKENFNILMPGLKFKPIGFNALHKYQKNRNKQDLVLAVDEMSFEIAKDAYQITLPVLFKYKDVSIKYDFYNNSLEISVRSNPFNYRFGNDFGVMPVVRVRIPGFGDMLSGLLASENIFKHIWEHMEPQLSLKLTRAANQNQDDGEILEKEARISDIFDFILLKNVDTRDHKRTHVEVDEQGNKTIYISRQMVFIMNYILDMNQITISTPLSLPFSLNRMADTPEDALKQIICPFLVLIALRNDYVHQKCKTVWDKVISFLPFPPK